MAERPPEIERQKRRALELVTNNQLIEARRLYADITRQAPQDARAWFMLGTVEGRLGNLPAAETAMCNSLAADSELGEGWLGLGQVLELQGRQDDAYKSYRKAVAQNPRLAEAHAALGHIYHVRGWDEPAAEHLIQALKLGATQPRAILELGDVHRVSGRFREALSAYRTLEKQRPDDAGLLAKIATMHYELNELEAAEQCFQQVLQLNPGHSGAKLGLINIWYVQKEQARALAAIQALFKTHHNDYGVVALYTRLCHLDGNCAAVIAQAEALLDHPGLTPQAERLLCFDLGRLYDGQRQYDRAFAYYRRGNTFKAGRYDREAADQSVAAILSGYSAEVLAKTASITRARHRPLFIVGMPRSGTSLVEQILASHPDVHGAGELTELATLLRSWRESVVETEHVHHEAELMGVADLNAMAERYLERLEQLAPGDVRYVSDKMPSNFFRLGLIHKLFPDAPVIHVRRNPIDTCLSCYFQDFAGAHPYSYDLNDLVHYYHNYRRLMACWRERLPTPMLEVDYEHLVADSAGVVRQMLDFLGLDWDDRCMQFYKSERAVITASQTQVQNPIYSRSVSRWRNYAKHIGPLIEGFANDTDD